MIPENKAKELFNMVSNEIDFVSEYYQLSKKISIMMVDEIIKVTPYISTEHRETVEQFRSVDWYFESYWVKVKEEINKL